MKYPRFIMPCIVAGIVGTLVGSLFASGYKNPPAGASAFGRHGGNIALESGPSAVTHNPANLVEIEQPVVESSLTLTHSKGEFRSPMGPKAKTESNSSYLPNVYGAFPLKNESVVLGMGVTVPYGNSSEWEDDGILRYATATSAQLYVLNFNPTVSFSVNENLSIGVGASVYYSNIEFEQYVPWGMITGVAGLPDGKADVDGDGTGFGGNLGLTYQVTENQKVGFTYRSAFDIDYEGDADLSNIPAPLAGLAFPSSSFDSEIKYPTVVGLGYGIQVNDQLKLGVDVEWIEFSRYQTLPIDLGANAASGLFPSEIPQKWDDVWNFFLGADYQVNEAVVLRGGYAFLPTPVPQNTVSPNLIDEDRHFLTAGVGWTKDAHTIDVALAIGLEETLTSSDNVNPAFNGEYEISSQFLELSYSYRF